MIVETSNLLAGALSQALETMAFLDIMPIEEDLPTPEQPLLAEISFIGPESGDLQLLASMDFARILAENIGALDDVEDEHAFDAMKEMANVVCGLILPMIAPDLSDVFDMTVPTVKSGNDSPQWSEFAQGSCVLNVEGHTIAAKLNMKD